MAFPSSTGSKALTLVAALNLAQSMASTVKARAQSLSTSSTAGNVPATSILDFLTFLADAKLSFQKAAASPGLAAYAQAQVGDADIANEFTAMTTALDAVTAWAIANFPKAGGFLSVISFTVDNTGRTQTVQFSAAQLATFKTLLDALVATID